MAVRRSARRNAFEVKPQQLLAPLVTLGLIGFVASDPLAFVGLALLLIAGATTFWFLRQKHRLSLSKAVLTKTSAEVARHENALVGYFRQSRRVDQFGNSDNRRWHEHIDTFLRTQVVPEFADFVSWRRSALGEAAAALVDAETGRAAQYRAALDPLSHVDAASLTPLEYEQHCAAILSCRGWTVHLTSQTRDGGADFIAQKGDWRMVVQCKRYAQPVGNKAVQEVYSAVSLYSGNVACVVAPTGFTKQAQQEAHGLSVRLLHHSSLSTFAEQLAA